MKLVVLIGGSSNERLVSYSSGIAIYKSLLELNHDVILIDPALDKQELSDDFLAQQSYKNAEYYDFHHPKHLEKLDEHLEYIAESIQPDIVFLALHGGYGEDGTVQERMDKLGIRYTGSGSEASKLAMDKNRSKRLMQENGIRTAKWITYDQKKQSKFPDISDFGYPLIVKANHGGSSVGLTIVHKVDDLQAAIDLALDIEDEIMIEEYIKGREITISILNNKCYPPIEIKPKHEYYDYECKYTKGMTEYIVPADLEPQLLDRINETALRCFQLLGLEVYGRIDFLLKPDDNYYCLEANSLPGMTETSLIPKSMGFAGLSFTEIVEQIINQSLTK
ncbi:MAG: D-alanine--D-alanine ligase [Calditrichaeota bacterium]|nr:D-alanine--D-alanine ligase [Calditrichota bacterium]